MFGHTDKVCPRKPMVTVAKIWIPKKRRKTKMSSDITKGLKGQEDEPGRNKDGEHHQIAIVDEVKEKGSSPSTSGLDNRFTILESVTEQSEYIEEVQTSNFESKSVVDDELNGRKPRAAAAGVAELMRNLKPRRKGPIDKGMKQMNIGHSASRNSSSSSIT